MYRRVVIYRTCEFSYSFSNHVDAAYKYALKRLRSEKGVSLTTLSIK